MDYMLNVSMFLYLAIVANSLSWGLLFMFPSSFAFKTEASSTLVVFFYGRKYNQHQYGEKKYMSSWKNLLLCHHGVVAFGGECNIICKNIKGFDSSIFYHTTLNS